MTSAQEGMAWCLVGTVAAELLAIAGLRTARTVLRRRTKRLLEKELREAARQRLTAVSGHRTEQ